MCLLESTMYVATNFTVDGMHNDTDLNLEISFSYSFWFSLVLLVVTAPANIVLIYLLSHERKRISTCGFTTFAISLSVTDALVGLTTLPLQMLQSSLNHWPLGNVMCLLFNILDYGLTAVSCYQMAAMAYDRYKCVTTPISYRTNFQQRRIVATTVVIWIWGIGCCATAHTFTYLTTERDPNFAKCASTGSIYLTISLDFIMFDVPIVLTVIAYVKLILNLRKRLDFKEPKPVGKGGSDAMTVISKYRDQVCTCLKGNSDMGTDVDHNGRITRDVPGVSDGTSTANVFSGQTNHIGEKHNRTAQSLNAQNKKCTRTSILIVMGFLACWGPSFLIWPIAQICGNCIDMDIFSILFMFSFTNSAINPFIYLATSVQLRQGFRKLFLMK